MSALEGSTTARVGAWSHRHAASVNVSNSAIQFPRHAGLSLSFLAGGTPARSLIGSVVNGGMAQHRRVGRPFLRTGYGISTNERTMLEHALMYVINRRGMQRHVGFVGWYSAPDL